MATIRKRGNSYQIRVSCGYDTSGKQVEHSMTWKPDPKMTEKQIQKELNKQAVIFEEACSSGQISTVLKFQEFAEQWFKEYAEIRLKAQTLRAYHYMEKRVYKAIGIGCSRKRTACLWECVSSINTLSVSARGRECDL